MTTTTEITLDDLLDFGWLLGHLFTIDVAVGLCTCCAEPRPAVRFGDEREEWGHVDDEMVAEMRHIHVEGGSSDCDGTYSRSYVYRIPDVCDWALRPHAPTWEQETPDFHSLVTYVFTHLPSIWGGPTSIEVDIDAGFMRWGTRTEEGHDSGEARICGETHCAHDRDTFRDHRAESAGY